MNDAFLSLALLALTIVTLLSTRRRGLVVQIAAEVLLLLAIGAFLAWYGATPLPQEGSFPPDIFGTWLRALAVIWWLIGARLIVNVTIIARGRDPRSRDARLFSDLVAGVIYLTAVLIILNSVLNLPINGLIATSGVVAIVLGLALQNTLADVFSGIAVGLEQPFHVGDRVSLANNVEGTIVQMNWRSIRVQTDGEDLATIPNSVVAKGQIINRSVPTSRRAATIEVIAPPETSSEIVLELMRQATLLCPNILTVPAPAFSLRGFDLTAVTYTATFFVADSPTFGAAKSAMFKQVRRLFRHAGIGGSGVLSDANLIGSLVLFEALSNEETQELATKLAVHATEPGDVIFEQGSEGTSIYIVTAGVMEIIRESRAGKTDNLGRIGPGEYIGELGLITGANRGITMSSLTHGRILELPAEGFAELLKSNSALNVAMERSVRRGLAMLDRDEAARSAHPAEQVHDLRARIRAFFRV